MPRRDFSGNAVDTTIVGGISATDLTIIIADATGWPSGGGSGKFYVTIDRGASNEERVLIASRTGTTLTVDNTSDRGVDDTTAATHNANADITHGIAAADADEANAHIFDTVRDDHTQYLTNARHDVEARHQFGGALGTPGAPSDIGTVPSAGTGDDAAREDHVHQIGAGAIDDPTMFAAGVVDAAAIGPDAVGTSELGPDAVTSAELADNAVGNEHMQDNSIGNAELQDLAVGTAELQDDAVTAAKAAAGIIDNADKVIDSILPFIKLLSGEATHYVPTFGGTVLGTGGTSFGRYWKIDKLVIGVAGFNLGTGGNVTASLTCSLPTACVDDGADWIFAARATIGSPAARASGMGVILGGDNKGSLFVTIGTGEWDATNPFNWAAGAVFRGVFVYESAT